MNTLSSVRQPDLTELSLHTLCIRAFDPITLYVTQSLLCITGRHGTF